MIGGFTHAYSMDVWNDARWCGKLRPVEEDIHPVPGAVEIASAGEREIRLTVAIEVGNGPALRSHVRSERASGSKCPIAAAPTHEGTEQVWCGDVDIPVVVEVGGHDRV